MITTDQPTFTAPEILKEAMDIAYIKSRKELNAPRKSWSSIRSQHV